MSVLHIRKEIGKVTELIPEECISECIVEEIVDALVPRRRTRDSHAQGKLEELKVIIVVEGDAEYIEKLSTA